jgi:hypothetical protein
LAVAETGLSEGYSARQISTFVFCSLSASAAATSLAPDRLKFLIGETRPGGFNPSQNRRARYLVFAIELRTF